MIDGRMVQLGMGDAERAGTVLARAFQDDPLHVWLFPEADVRNRLYRELYISAIRFGCLYGESWAVVREPRNEIAAAAFWIPVPGAELTPQRLKRSGMADALAVWGSENWERLETSLDVIDAAQERIAPPPHLYLVSVGVDPSWQRHGYGGALLEQFAARAAANRVTACLWTMQPANIPFYQGHGFAVVEEGVVPECDLPYWIFRRDAVAP